MSGLFWLLFYLAVLHISTKGVIMGKKSFNCCAPTKYEATIEKSVILHSAKTGMPLHKEEVRLYMDYSKKRMVTVEMLENFPLSRLIKFKTNEEFITFKDKCFVSSKQKQVMPPQCTEPDAVYEKTVVIGSKLDKNRLEAEVWHLRRSHTDYKRTAVASHSCIPIWVESVSNGVITVENYMNATPEIRNRTLFDVPRICV